MSKHQLLISFCSECIYLQKMDLRDINHVLVPANTFSEAIHAFIDLFLKREINDLWIRIWTFFTKIITAVRVHNLYEIDDDFVNLEAKLNTIGNYSAVSNLEFAEVVRDHRELYHKILLYIVNCPSTIIKIDCV
jgi:hypothetical protein